MPGLFAEIYRSSLCHMVQKLQVVMSGANLGTHTLADCQGQCFLKAHKVLTN